MRDDLVVQDREMCAIARPLFLQLHAYLADRREGQMWQGNLELFLEGKFCWCSGEGVPRTCRERPITRLVSLLNGENGRLWFEEFQRFMKREPCWECVKPPRASVTCLASRNRT